MTPEYPEYANSSSNNRKISTHACIEPIPRPSVHPNGGEARSEAVRGRERINKTKADSPAAISIATVKAPKMLRYDRMTEDRIILSTNTASIIPTTMP